MGTRVIGVIASIGISLLGSAALADGKDGARAHPQPVKPHSEKHHSDLSGGKHGTHVYKHGKHVETIHRGHGCCLKHGQVTHTMSHVGSHAKPARDHYHPHTHQPPVYVTPTVRYVQPHAVRYTHTRSHYVAQPSAPIVYHTPKTIYVKPERPRQLHGNMAGGLVHHPHNTHVHRGHAAPYSVHSAPKRIVHTKPMYHPPKASHPVVIDRRCHGDAVKKLRPTADGRTQYSVCYADLAPIDPSTAPRAYRRIKVAADKACDTFLTLTPKARRQERACEASAVEQAVIDVNNPALFEFYKGKRFPAPRPKVIVEEPRYH